MYERRADGTVRRRHSKQYPLRQRQHNQLRWPGPKRRERMLVVPVSPSGHRAPDNMRAVVRRMLREDGMLPTAAEAEFEADKKPIDRMAFLEKRLSAIEHRLGALEQQQKSK
jgi:hypothetical protein